MPLPDSAYRQFTPDVRICRLLNGLWQVSGAHGSIQAKTAVQNVFDYHDAGFTTWDLADHYGPAEDFIGAFRHELAALRDSAFAAATPDCATEIAIKLGDAMSQAVSAFQAYLNGNMPDLGNTITEINEQLDGVAAAQNALIERMTSQFQAERPPAAP